MAAPWIENRITNSEYSANRRKRCTRAGDSIRPRERKPESLDGRGRHTLPPKEDKEPENHVHCIIPAFRSCHLHPGSGGLPFLLQVSPGPLAC